MRTEIIALLLIFSLPAQADTKKAPAKHKAGPQPTSYYLISGADNSEKQTDDELLKMLKGFQFLLRTEPPGSRRDNLLIAAAGTGLALSRSIRIKPKPSDADRELELKYSRVALRDAEDVQKSKTATSVERAKAMFYSGLAKIDLKDMAGAVAIFRTAIQLYPDDQNAPGMSIFIAETLFDDEKYKEAIDEYLKYYKHHTQSQKAVVIYKVAWCYINLQNFELAEKNFLLLAGKKWAGNLAKDSIQDLAYTMSLHRKDEDVIAFTAGQFKDNPALRLDVMTRVYKFYLAQSGTHEHPILFAELMRTERDPAKRLSLYIVNLRSKQRAYASKEPYGEFLNIRKEMAVDSIRPGSSVFAKVSSEMEPEIETLIRSYNDTFAGKAKTPELNKKEIGTILLELLEFHTQYFQTSTDLAASYGIWIDICQQMNDNSCSYQVSRKIMQVPSLKALHPRARLTWLSALDGLVKKDPKYRDEFIDGLTQFYENSPTDSQWLTLTKKLTVLLNEEKKFKVSIPILKKLDEVEKTSESRFRRVWAMYQNEEMEEVAALGPTGNDNFTVDTKKLVREAHLRMASQEIDKNNFDSYQSHINDYIAANPDDEKSEMVRRDYFNRSLDRHEDQKVFEFLVQAPYAKRFSKVYKAVSIRLIDTYLRKGNSEKAFELITKGAPGKGKEKSEEFELEKFQALLGMDRLPSQHELVELHASVSRIREYVLGVLTLAKPESTITYFRTWPPVTLADKNTLLLAEQMKAGSWEVELDPRTTQMLDNVLPQKLKTFKLTAVEKQLQLIQIPDKNISEKRLVTLAAQLRSTRAAVGKSLANKAAKVQRRILGLAIGLEEKMSAKIIGSPPPAGLSDDQLKQYQTGLEALAKEFSDQADEYKKIVATMDKYQQTEDQDQKNLISSFDIKKWPVPKSDLRNDCEKLLDKHNLGAALVAIDRSKAASDLKPDDYFRMRAWILITYQSTDFMKEYARTELVNAKQTDLLNDWGATKK